MHYTNNKYLNIDEYSKKSIISIQSRQKRGRPIKVDQDNMLSKQIIIKKLAEYDIEILDFALKYEIIEEKHFNVANRFRWLYTVFFGLPDIKTNFVIQDDFYNVRQRTDKWLQEKYHEYIFIIEYISKRNNTLIEFIKKTCIHNAKPKFFIQYINFKMQFILNDEDLDNNTKYHNIKSKHYKKDIARINLECNFPDFISKRKEIYQDEIKLFKESMLLLLEASDVWFQLRKFNQKKEEMIASELS